MPVFIFDRNILDELEDKQDRRVEFIHHALQNMQQALVKMGSTLDVRYGFPQEYLQAIIAGVYILKRFLPIMIMNLMPATGIMKSADLLKANGISFHTYKDQVIFEKSEVVKDDG